ncbi:MAG: MFS transporter [Bacteroidales bacterium]|nr:MFS transporter [Bacteroidales bacterium]
MRFTMFALLYFAQGSILGYFTALNALYLLSHDLSMSQAGLFSAIALIPLILKIFLGILSDRISFLGLGHRKPYIIMGLLLQASMQIVFPFIHPAESFGWLVFVAFISLTGMALYDTCTDGLAVDITPERDRSHLQGIMVAGRALGIVLIAALVGVLSDLTNWTWVFMALAAMTLLPLPFVVAFRIPPHPPERSFEWQAFRVFQQKPIIAIAMLGLISSMITGGANQLVNPFLKENFGISYMTAGFYSAIFGIGMIGGGLTGGQLIRKIGYRRAVITAMAVSLVTVMALAQIVTPGMAWPLLFCFGLSYGYYETTFFATAMSRTHVRIAASMFAILMAFSNLGSAIGLAGGGRISDIIGYRWTFTIFAAMNLLVILLLPPLFGKRK